jgi:hypothetical protein
MHVHSLYSPHLTIEHGSPAFEEFLDFLGDRVQLEGFQGYRGGLDVKGLPPKREIASSCVVFVSHLLSLLSLSLSGQPTRRERTVYIRSTAAAK